MFLTFFTAFSHQLTCRDTLDKDIDWYTVFKIPKLNDRIPNHVSGTGFFYHDPNIVLSESTAELDEKLGNPVYNTLKQLYRNSSVGWFMVSDQPPHREDTVSSSYAHKKGVLIYDDNGGVYIEHSVPRFPPDPAKSDYSYPETGKKYGQSMLCVTLDKKGVDLWAEGMAVEKGYVYSMNIPEYVKSEPIRKLEKYILNVEHWPKSPLTKVSPIKTKKASFTLFSKHKNWGADLYHDLIAVKLKNPTYSETWSRGPGNLPSSCDGDYFSYNILDVNFDGVKWRRTDDHSKWAVVGDYVCIGGINRQSSQFKRGGGSWCKKDPDFASIMKDVILDYEKCP